jgi:tRNA/tmRNA/rRNA uracil-C5-methylase (TrmA/RlmC/RlmD family)
MDFAIDFEGRVGLRQKGKWWRVIDGHTCFIADKRIEALFDQVRQWVGAAGLSTFDRKAHTGLLRYAVIRATRDGQSLINLVTSDPALCDGEARSRSAIEELAQTTQPTSLTWAINHSTRDVSHGDEVRVVSGPGYIEERIEPLGPGSSGADSSAAPLTYRVGPQSFFQTNSHAAPLLLQAVATQTGAVGGKTVLDLYCGSGFFSVPLGRRAERTVGVELDARAIAEARVNAALNDARVDYRVASMEEIGWPAGGGDVVILDPPRVGLHDKVLAALLAARPPLVVYVSCNYKSFAREMLVLQDHYEVQAMCAIDMFPHTPHVELVSRLEHRTV